MWIYPFSIDSGITFEDQKIKYTVKHEPSLACTKCNNSFQAESYQLYTPSRQSHLHGLRKPLSRSREPQ